MLSFLLALLTWISADSPQIDLAQRYVSRTAHVHVESANRFKTIVADNYQVYSEISSVSGTIKLTGLVKSFEFDWGALDQAFHSSRVDLSQYAKFTFTGSIENLAAIDFARMGQQKVVVSGILKMGGYSRKTSAQGTMTIQPDGRLKAKADFVIRIEEASVATINKMMRDKLPSVMAVDVDRLGISRDIRLSLSATYRPR
ncbi:MAG: hypothetical protein AAFQ02_04875 [Bacteroidota bacterium]